LTTGIIKGMIKKEEKEFRIRKEDIIDLGPTRLFDGIGSNQVRKDQLTN